MNNKAFILGIIVVAAVIGFITYLIIEFLHPTKKVTYTDCNGTRFGCCNDKTTPKYDPFGTNCFSLKKDR